MTSHYTVVQQWPTVMMTFITAWISSIPCNVSHYATVTNGHIHALNHLQVVMAAATLFTCEFLQMRLAAASGVASINKEVLKAARPGDVLPPL